jgi:hypothetical protein
MTPVCPVVSGGSLWRAHDHAGDLGVTPEPRNAACPRSRPVERNGRSNEIARPAACTCVMRGENRADDIGRRDHLAVRKEVGKLIRGRSEPVVDRILVIAVAPRNRDDDVTARSAELHEVSSRLPRLDRKMLEHVRAKNGSDLMLARDSLPIGCISEIHDNVNPRRCFEVGVDDLVASVRKWSKDQLADEGLLVFPEGGGTRSDVE